MLKYFMDTDCELWYTYAEELGVDIIRMPYIVDDQEYLDNLGKDMDIKGFYQQLKNGSSAKTSALNMQNYLDYFEPVFANGDDILYVHFSSEMSGTFAQLNSAIEILKEKYPERTITLADSLQISIGGGLMVYDTAKMWKNGASPEEIVNYVNQKRNNYATCFLVDSLSFLRKGGRLSATSFVAGTILNIKPILKIDKEGKISKHGVANGKKKGIKELAKIVIENIQEKDKHPIIIGHADDEQSAIELKNHITAELGENIDVRIQLVGPTIGAHCGPGTVGVAFYTKQR